MKKQAKPMGELALIEQIRRGSGGRFQGLALGIGDDCAILRPAAGSEVLVTTDLSLEGRHFRRDLHPAESAGHRCLARGLSDLAAMGAVPMAAFLSLALPGKMLATGQGRSWVDGFFRGLRGLGDRYRCPLAGGDTAESGLGTAGSGITGVGLVLADITLVGTTPRGKALRRSGGRVGDWLYCTGRLGGAAAELEGMLARGRMGRIGAGEHPQLFPEPRVAVGVALRRRGLAGACIDLSDGLSTDLRHLCTESRVGAEVEEAALPLHPLAARLGASRALRLALNGGEDYELLFSAGAEVKVPRSVAGVAITRIGRLVRGGDVTLVRADGRREGLEADGWKHFRGSD
jgi:thiamine-monophosphate kinase